MRRMLGRVRICRSDLILPVFVCEGKDLRTEIPSMPGIFRYSVDTALDWLTSRAEQGFSAFLAFGVIERSRRDDTGSVALDGDNVVCRLIREAKKREIPMLAATDLCFCEYTSHGHCGPLKDDPANKGICTVDNDRTVELLVKQALSHARAGADIIAPSGRMDLAVAALRRGLDNAGFDHVVLLSYAIKYASAFYGPFRDAVDSSPAQGDRRGYQMDPARGLSEALHQAKLDIQQGADMVMVKPAGPYLDVIAAIRQAVDVPVVAYQVSGEYAMLQSAARNGWLDGPTAALESLLAIKRAGADLIVTYFGQELASLLDA
jgi:porphobilinogen synthase